MAPAENRLALVTSTPPSERVSDRLAAAAATAVVGRTAERARLAALLGHGGPAVVFVTGPGGIGKSWLIDGTLADLGTAGLAVRGREIEPTVPAFLDMVGSELGGPTPATAAEASMAMARAGIGVLVVESYERLGQLDDWLREELTAGFPDHVKTLLVSRREPGLGWRTAPGWRHLVGELVVGPMNGSEVDDLLSRRNADKATADKIRAFAQGHPLAIELAVEAFARHPRLELGAGTLADVVEELFEVLLDDLNPDERRTVEAASVLRRITRPGLAAVLGADAIEPAWQTLRRLPFTTATPSGLELSGVAQTVIGAALEARDADLVSRLRDRASTVGLAEVDRTTPTRATGVAADLMRLSPREREVLTLLAEGLTNRQLASELFISERTANRHVSNIFGKLSVHNRTEAARVAVEAGLMR